MPDDFTRQWGTPRSQWVKVTEELSEGAKPSCYYDGHQDKHTCIAKENLQYGS